MSKCKVCGNVCKETKCTRPGVVYHRFPKNEYMKIKWLKVFGIDRCSDWHRVCSDHFLEENYRPGLKRYLKTNTIPQPYDRKCDKNGFPSNYVTTNNEDLSYENIPSLQTDVVPMLTKDHTLGTGIRCSVEHCFNRHSKDLSFFGHPKDLTLRIKWMKKCGLKRDPITLPIRSARVCSTHFDDDCFLNIKIKKRLKPGAVPSLFLHNADKIDTRNISPVNGGFISANKPSSSSSSYVANMESNQTPLLVYMDSTTPNAKDFEACCSTPGCLTDTVKEVEDISVFAPTIECVNDSSSVLGLQLTTNTIVCERHFRPQDILNTELLVNGFNEKIKSLAPYSLPVLSNEVPVLTTYEDQFLSRIDNKTDEQSSEKKINYELDNTDNCCISNLMSIDDSSANSSLLINLEPIENSEVLIEPSLDLSISPTKKSSSSELIEIKTEVTSKFTALTRNSDTHDSNSNCSIRTQQCNLIDVCSTEDFKIDKNGLIFEISKDVVLPHERWHCAHLSSKNITGYYERNSLEKTLKRIHFYNSLVPSIQICNKKYKYDNCITTKNDLENLLEKISDITKCNGRNGFNHKNCMGYVENCLEDISMCSACHGWITKEVLERKQRQVESKSRTILSLETKIAERTARVLKLRETMAKNKKKYVDMHRPVLKPSGISDIMKP